MLQIKCPWCGPRDQTEFSYGGEAHIVRPGDPYALSDEDWADYLNSHVQMDVEVGQILRSLEETGVADNTIVFFCIRISYFIWRPKR